VENIYIYEEINSRLIQGMPAIIEFRILYLPIFKTTRPRVKYTKL
jgi:hypothetical protein